jgi:hypothetical protein
MKKRILASVAGLALAAAAAVHAAPARPDFSGMWLIRNSPDVTKTVDGKDPPLKPGKRATGEDPSKSCLPTGPVRAMVVPYPVKILSRPGQVTLMHEFYHLVRLIYIDGKHPPAEEWENNYMGHSIAKWSGDTLVVDTVGLNGITWLDHKGLPSSPKTHVTERMRLVEGGKALEDVITIDDPENYTAPWSERVVFDRRPDLQLQQHICGERVTNRQLPIPPAPKP